MNNISWAQLAEKVHAMSDEQQRAPVVVFDPNEGEVLPVGTPEFADEHSNGLTCAIDEGQPFLTITHG